MPRKAEEAILDELRNIGEAVWLWIAPGLQESDGNTRQWKRRWDAQIDAFPQMMWAVQPWLTAGECFHEFSQLPVNQDSGKTPLQTLRSMLDLAEKWLPPEDRDRQYHTDDTKSKLNNPGVLWAAHYALVDAKLAARRHTRNFDTWNSVFGDTPVKDSLSGKEECIGGEAFWSNLHDSEPGLFPKAHHYGALTLIKRLWCRDDKVSYLRDKTGLSSEEYKRALGFESVPAIACNNRPGSSRKDDDGEDIPDNPYVAILAMDGDEMGKWVSAEKTPPFLQQLSPQARDYLEPILEAHGKRDIRRLLTPSYHIQFSEALSNFSTWLSDQVVRRYKGQLIYSGGDDVLAMLPADKAIACAEALRSVFRGEPPRDDTGGFPVEVPLAGYVMGPAGYPLIVPGPAADVSIGLAVGHCKAPLQMLVREAKRAEQSAKSLYARSALTVHLYKRSGEIIEWGCKWDDGDKGRVALKLYHRTAGLSPKKTGESTPLSGRFSSMLAQLLAPYDLHKLSGAGAEKMQDIMLKELDHVIERQGQGLKEEAAKEFRDLCGTWLKQTKNRPEDFVKLFLVEAFINRHGGGEYKP